MPSEPQHFPLVTGWYRGEDVQYYDFGAHTPLVGNTPLTAPIWAFIYGMDADGNPQFVPGQHNIIDVVPGDEGYSDLWLVNLVTVPADYEADSLRSVDDVSSSGYSVTTTEILVNCPVVPEGSTLETGMELTQGWYRGEAVFYFDFGPHPAIVAPIYVPVTGTDDQGNPMFVEGQYNIIDVVPGDEGYSDFWLVNLVTVPEGYTANDLKSHEDVTASGYEVSATDLLVNCPVHYYPVDAVPPEAADSTTAWPLPNHDYENTRASMDAAIDSSNVADLGVAWSFPIDTATIFGAMATNPVITESMVFFQDLENNIYALNRDDGSLVWHSEYNIPNIGPNGVAVGWGKVFAGVSFSEIVALDMMTGQEIWRQELPVSGSEGIDIQPQVYGGMVMVSTVPGNSVGNFYAGGGTGVIFALDQGTGDIIWSFNTVDSEDIWGNPDINSGGGSWYPAAVDTGTGVTYWSVVNPAPWPGTEEFPNGTSRPGDNLYTDSLVALNPDGTLAWYTQVLPHDILDHDLQMSPVLATTTVNGTEQDIVITAGKMGVIYAISRDTGEILWETPVGTHQNDDLQEFPTDGSSVTVFPGVFGGVETPMAYADGMIYAAVVNLSVDATGSSVEVAPFTEGTGELVAVDAATGEIAWSVEYGFPNFGGATVVNDLVLTATCDGMVYAYDRMTGAEVFSWQAPAGINGWPAVAGDMIVWPCGQGGTPTLVALSTEAAGPILHIVSPSEGEILPSGNLTVSVEVLNFDLVEALGEAAVEGEGHLHFYLDVEPPTTPGQPAVTENGTYMVTTGTTVTWENVAAGEHTLSVQLVNNDHTPLSDPVVATTTVMVSDPWVTIDSPSPALIQTTTEPSVTVNVTVSNFTLGEGQGGLIYYLDTEPPVNGGGPARTAEGTYQETTETSVTFDGLEEGLHRIYVQLVDANGMPLDIPVVARTLVVVSVMGQQTGP
jgi:outer membrane protein assembly factor BamB